jgi:ribosome-binding factor A
MNYLDKENKSSNNNQKETSNDLKHQSKVIRVELDKDTNIMKTPFIT